MITPAGTLHVALRDSVTYSNPDSKQPLLAWIITEPRRLLALQRILQQIGDCQFGSPLAQVGVIEKKRIYARCHITLSDLKHALRRYHVLLNVAKHLP